MRLESFAPGRDRGIDMRFAEDRVNKIVVQCKHYARSTWPDLRRSLEAEVPKVQSLAPSRYLIATSMPMTPDRKDWVVKLFAPHCQGPGDVLGSEDLNNLLARHADVESRHHKLWLTSIPVLQRILNSDVFSDQASELEHITRKVSGFVANDSIQRALAIINERHFCVITGVPGIGKTTLAEMLVIDHLARGFECFRVWDDIGDARRVFRANTNQLFYYDDFLGRTGLRTPSRNEDERLLRFIGDMAHSPHHRLILTSRDYILHQASFILEGLSRADLEPARCVVSLGDYTPRIRAEILYNHLYHSRIPKDYIIALVESRVYREIVRHRNYSPRIIEAMTNTINIRDVGSKDYPTAFIANLDNPRRLWEVAYASHLTFAAQNALLVVATLSDEVRFEEAEKAFEAFHRSRCEQYRQPSTPYDWKRALKELDGTFLTIGPSHGAITIKFHNPSVRDFIEGHLRQNIQDVVELSPAAAFPNQLTRLGRILASLSDRSWVIATVEHYLKLFDGPSGVPRIVQISNRTVWWIKEDSPIARLIDLGLLAALGAPKDISKPMEAAKALVLSYVDRRMPDREELTSLLRAILDKAVPQATPDDAFFRAVLARAYGDLDSPDIGLDEYDALVAFSEDYPVLVGDKARADLRTHFGPLADAELDTLSQFEPDMQLNIYDQLAHVAERLGVQLKVSRDAILEDLPYGPDDEDDSRFGSGHGEGGGMSDGDLDSMFDGLKH